MDLILYVMLVLMIRSAMAMTKQRAFGRSNALENKNATSGIISSSEKTTTSVCAGQCFRNSCCQSFFFNSITGECQLHNDVFTSTVYATKQEGLRYYHIIGENIVSCPVYKGFELLEDNRTCVKFHSDIKTWCEASRICKSYSMYSRLVVVDNQQKNNLVKERGRTINEQFGRKVWMGLFKNNQNIFRWVGGGNLSYTDWRPDDFNTSTENNCGAYHRKRWRWVMHPCTEAIHYICEI